MINKKYIALALSLGLVFAGGHSIVTNPTPVEASTVDRTTLETRLGTAKINLELQESLLREAQAAYIANSTYTNQAQVSRLAAEVDKARNEVNAAQTALNNYDYTYSNTYYLSTYRNQYKNSIDALGNLSYTDRASYKAEIDKAVSQSDIISIYNRAVVAHNNAAPSYQPQVINTPYQTITRTNANRYTDERVLIQRGEYGQQRLSSNGRWINIKNPVNEIIEVGTNVRGTSTSQYTITPIKYKTVRRPSSTLEEGKQRTIQTGKDGYIKSLYGVEIDRVNATDEIIEYGTKTTTYTYPFRLYPDYFNGGFTVAPDPDKYYYDAATDSYKLIRVVTKTEIKVPAGYKYIKAGTYDSSVLEEQRDKLKKAVKDNKAKQNAAQYLLDVTPKTVAGVKGKLVDLINKSVRLQKQSEAAVAELDRILQ